MRNNSSFTYSVLLVLGDFVAILAAFVWSYILRVKIDTRELANQVPAETYLQLMLLVLPFWLVIFALLGLYEKNIYEKRYSEFVRILTGSIIGIMAIISADFVMDQPIFPGRIVPVYALLISICLLLTARQLLRVGRRVFFGLGRGVNNLMIIGNSRATYEIAEALSDTAYSGYRIVGIVARQEYIPESLRNVQMGTLSTALEKLDTLQVHSIIQTEMYDTESKNQLLYDTAQTHHVSFRFIPSHGALLSGSNTVELFHNYPVIAVHPTALIGWGRVAKRLFDIIAASIGMVLTAPILAICAIIIKLTDPRYPVIYRDKRRVTRFGRHFTTYKLRSIYGKYSPGLGAGRKTEVEIFESMGRPDLAQQWRDNHKVSDDPRIMPIGRFIRKTSIDELPQFWNVLKGDISMIGPRPVPKDELKRYAEASSLFLSIKPGITGLWQVSGRNELSYDERIALELYYVQNWSFLLDLKIVYRTVRVMLLGKGQ